MTSKISGLNLFKSGSISRNLVLLVVAVMLPALAILLYTGLEQRRHSIEHAKDDVLLLTRSMAAGQQDMTSAARLILSTLAQLPEIRELNLAAGQEILTAVLRQNPDFENITLTDLDGRALISGGAFFPANLADCKHFQQALVRRDFAVGEYTICRVGGTDPLFPFAYPVLGADGQPAAVLTMAVSLSRFARFYDASRLPDESFVAVIDHRGIRLFYYPPREESNPVGQPIVGHSWEIAQGAREPGVYFAEGSDGMRWIFAFHPIRLTPDEEPYIYLWAGIPEGHVLEPANALLARNLLLLGLATVISLLLACFLGRRKLVVPITNLVGLTRSFAEGRLDARLAPAKMPAEIMTLTRSFYDMAAELAESQQNVRESEARFRLVMNSLEAIVYVADMETYEILFINEFSKRHFGDVTGKPCWQSLQKGQQGPCSFCTNRFLLNENGQPAGIYTWEFKNTVTGQWFYIRDRAIRWVDGRLVRLEVATDISARKEAEKRLAEETQRLAVTLQSIGDGVVTTDTGERVVMLNPVAEALTGWSSAEAAGRPLTEILTLVRADTGEPGQNPVARVLSSGEVAGLEKEAVLRARDGRERRIADSAAPIKDRHGAIIGAVMVFRDITEQLRTEQELLKVKKLESIGVLAGGLAHDFNNILTAILGNIQLSMLDPQLPEKLRGLLQEAAKASNRARDLTSQLLTFAKGGQPIRRTASLVEVIRDSADFVLRGSKTACRYSFPDDLQLVDIDTGQISQVVQNLILNAGQAMPEGGVIEVAAENVDADTAGVALPGRGAYVKMSVRDHGIGIPANILDRIFDPYFTTRQLGSGLGLAICHSIVARHEGLITVHSAPGQGTVFELYLPAAASAAAVAGGKRAEDLPAEKKKARILVMDDEEMIRQLNQAVLTGMGHEVLLAAEGAEAVRLYRESKTKGKPVDLVIMDMTVPGGMGGKEAVSKILALDPAARVVVASGYSHDPIMANFADHGFRAALVKPFTLQELNRVLNLVLE